MHLIRPLKRWSQDECPHLWGSIFNGVVIVCFGNCRLSVSCVQEAEVELEAPVVHISLNRKVPSPLHNVPW